MKLCLVLGILLLAVAARGGASMHNPHYCFADDRTKPQSNMHAVITSYDSIRRIDFSTVNPLAALRSRTASRFWYLGRYGIRLPLIPYPQWMIDFVNSGIIDEIVRNYEAGLTTLCLRDFENIRNYTMEPDFTIENGESLRESGVLELQNIARRFQDAYPDMLPREYSPSQYHFRHFSAVFSNQSARAFASGLFDDTEAENVVYEPVPSVDWLLRPFGYCPLFTAALAEQGDYEKLAFVNGPEVQQMDREINEKLGFRGMSRLDHVQIDMMWQLCRFQMANTFATGAHSPWCAPFSVAHQQLLVYLEDVQFYYRTGYGFRNRRLQENMVCGILQDLVLHMRSDNDSDQKARIFFSYLSEMQSMLVALGAFRDVWEINQYNYAQQANRQWYTSLFTSFGANIVVVRYDSDDGDHDLLFLVNERPILVPGCDVQTGICKLSFIVDRFERFIDADCAEIFCSNE